MTISCKGGTPRGRGRFREYRPGTVPGRDPPAGGGRRVAAACGGVRRPPGAPQDRSAARSRTTTEGHETRFGGAALHERKAPVTGPFHGRSWTRTRDLF